MLLGTPTRGGGLYKRILNIWLNYIPQSFDIITTQLNICSTEMLDPDYRGWSWGHITTEQLLGTSCWAHLSIVFLRMTNVKSWIFCVNARLVFSRLWGWYLWFAQVLLVVCTSTFYLWFAQDFRYSFVTHRFVSRGQCNDTSKMASCDQWFLF